MAKITFLGAVGAVTGSKYLVEAGGKRLLVDCGLFQGSRELKQRNWDALPIDPASIDWIVLTHAHIDHTGYLPRIVRDGFRGPIYANAATHELCELLLTDSAHLQEEDAQYATKKGYSRHKPALPLYAVADAQQALTRFQEIPRKDPFTVSPQFTVKPFDAGHILGSSSLQITITENGKSSVVVFSGDVGRYNQPILNDPSPIAKADYILCESTYGDRDHPTTSPYDAIADIVNRVVKRGGVIVIPAFAVGRTQTLMYIFRQLEERQRIPRLPTFVDSPMAISVTNLYVRHKEDHSLQFTQLEQTGNHDPLNTHEVHMTRAVQDSKKINSVNSPCLIISASGMCTGGRILHHLAQRLPDARNVVILAGLPGGRHARPPVARRREGCAYSWRPNSRPRRDSGSQPVLRSWRPRRARSLAFRLHRASQTNFPCAWRTYGRAILSRHRAGKTSLARDDSGAERFFRPIRMTRRQIAQSARNLF